MLDFKRILSSLNNIKQIQILMFYDGHLWRKVRTNCNNQIYACFGQLSYTMLSSHRPVSKETGVPTPIFKLRRRQNRSGWGGGVDQLFKASSGQIAKGQPSNHHRLFDPIFHSKLFRIPC